MSNGYFGIPYLEKALENENEDPMVKHEAVIALGDLSKSKSTMTKYF